MKIKFLTIKINYLLLISAFTFAWIVLDSSYNITKIYNLYANFWVIDTVTFVQSLSSAIFSHLPFVNLIPGNSFFAVHASPILYLLVPFYSISPGFAVLYIIQAIIMYSPAVPLYLIARKKLENELNAFLISISYLFYNAIATGTFETLSLFAGFFIFAYYFYSEKKIIQFFIFFLLSLSTMEFSPILGGMFGLVLIIEKLRIKDLKSIISKDFSMLRPYAFGLTLIAISVMFFLWDKWMVSYFSGSTHDIMQNLYGTNPTSAQSILQGLMTSQSQKIDYFFKLNYPYFFISLLDPIALMQIPWYLAIWIAVFPYFGAYYESYTFPFVSLGAILGLKRLGKFSINKTMFLRILTMLILFGMAFTWIASPTFNLPSPVTQQGLGLIQVSNTIPANASIYSDIDSYPILASHSWNTIPFGFPRNYTVFNALNGPPYSLKGYGLYSASGTYVAYKKNYTNAPVLNNFYYENYPGLTSTPGAPFSYSVSMFLPKGEFQIYANLTQKNVPGIMIVNQGMTVWQYLPVTEMAIQSFTLDKTIQAEYIIINVQSTHGWYGFFAKITTSLNPYTTPIASTAFSNYACYVNKIQIPGPFTLNANTTYYLWVGTSGYPGGISIPIAHGTGLYLMNTTTNVMKKANNSMQFSIVGKIPGYVPKPTFIMFSYISGNISVVKSIYLTGKGYNLKLVVKSNGNFSTISFMTNYAYGSFMINPLVVKAPGAKQPHNFYLENIPVTLAIAMIPSFVLIALAFFDSGPLIEREKVRKILRIIGYGIGALFLLFFVVFGIGYYNVVPALYNVNIFAAFGYLITAFMLIYVFISYISREMQ
ncbi:MAG: DUF2079 domain-containing protein [Thermoplasmata archaeon]